MSRPVTDAPPKGFDRADRLDSRVLVLALAVLSLVLTLWRINAGSLWWDESLSLHRAQNDLGYILSGHIDFGGFETVDQHPPLYFLLLSAFTRLFGESDLVLRLPSALFAASLVPLVYACACELTDKRGALAASTLAALSPMLHWYGREARMYTMVAALAAFTLLCTLRTLRRSTGNRTTSTRWLLAGLISACATLATQYLYALSLAALAPPCLLYWRQSAQKPDRPLKSPWLILGAALLLVATLTVFALQVLRQIPSLATLRTHVALPIIVRDMFNSFAVGLSCNLRQSWPITLLFAMVWVFGIYATLIPTQGESNPSRAMRLANAVLLAGGVLIPAVLLWGFSFVSPVYTNSRYLITCAPLFYVTLGIASSRIAQGRRSLGTTVLMLLLVGTGYSLMRLYVDPYYRVKEDYAGAVALIARGERPHDLILVNGPENLTAFQHYYQGPGTVLALPRASMSSDELESELGAAIEQYDRVWLLRARTAISDPELSVADWLENHAMRTLFSGFPSCGNYIRVIAFELSPFDPATECEPRWVLDDQLALHQISLMYRDASGSINEQTIATGQPRAISIPAGTLLSLRMTWEPMQELADLRVSLRLVRDGETWTQQDQTPFLYLPSSEWPLGQTVRQAADLGLPADLPAAGYTLEMVVYRAEDGIPLIDPATGRPALDLGPIEIVQPLDYKAQIKAVTMPPAPGLPVSFGDLALSGLVLPDRALKPGDTLIIEMSWLALSDDAPPMVAVINLCDEQGEVYHSESQEPSGAGYQTTDWPKDRTIRGRIRLTLPPDTPAGTHSVHLLVYDAANARYLPLRRLGVPMPTRDLSLGSIMVR